MNICIVSPRYPYKDNMEFVFVKKLVDEWAKMGHHCYVFTDYSLITFIRGRISYKPHFYKYCVEGGVEVNVVNPRAISLGGIITRRGLDIDMWISTRVLARSIKNSGISFDFIYCHFFKSSLLGYSFALKTRVPVFVATGESTVPKFGKPLIDFDWAEYRKTVCGVVAVSEANRQYAIENGFADASKCKVFPNGTDLSVFRPLDRASCRKVLGMNNEDFIIICVGYYSERKGQNRILQAIDKLQIPGIKLVLVGSGEIRYNHKSIIFKDKVKNEDLPKYLSAADVFCLPTLSEGCCNAIVEALACGLPIISSDLPFNYDILNAGNSILVPPKDIDEIAAAIKRLYSDLGLRSKLSQESIRTAQNLSVQKRAERILSFIEDRIKSE